MSDDDVTSELQPYPSPAHDIVAIYENYRDHGKYRKLIKKLVNYLRLRNRNHRLQIIEYKKSRNNVEENERVRVTYFNAKDLYIQYIDHQTDEGITRINMGVVGENYPSAPENRIFWSPYHLFDINPNRHYPEIYISQSVNIAEATRFNEVMRYVAAKFSSNGRHNWHRFSDLINNWQRLTNSQNNSRVTVPWIP